MSHARTRIRDRAAALLLADSRLLQRVYVSRAYPAEDVPCVLVYTSREECDETQLQPILERRLDLLVECITRPGPLADDELDAMCVAVEQSLGAADAFGRDQSVMHWSLVSTDIVFAAGAGTVGTARLTFRIIYCTPSADPEA